eukprot:gnl/TRDRNA2_/TRDRNA2_172134_c2_seq1.p1 gnl/TRDRNA2_/TRDRNA2_172134_c2~~gnl/TRDRNA2_/TRDRNA2_172134_c2_seq1.p1  ORF type:complete len:284 (-),score=52.98 gnl/TRDRNA2_/TRDRNA2_172134_c2_seq1:74-925(-)
MEGIDKPGIVKTPMPPLWRPPPSMESVKASIEGDPCRHFVRFTKNNSYGEFGKFERMKPKILDVWTAARAVEPERNYKYPKGFKGYRYHAQSESIPAVSDAACSKQHRDWLQTHYVARDKHLYPVYHALERVDKAKTLYDKNRQQRELTRDLLTRTRRPEEDSAESSQQLSEAAKAGLQKAKIAVRTAAALGTANLAFEEEERDRKRLEKAKSNPVLRIHDPIPEHHVQHMRSWKGPDHPLRLLKESTPFLAREEEIQLHKLGKGPPHWGADPKKKGLAATIA